MEDLTGNVYGKLTVLRRGEGVKKDWQYWLCQCECGNTISPDYYNLKGGRSKSCGCLRGEKNRKRLTTNKGAEYEAWRGIKQRCYNPNAANYSYYGGRGIKVCDEWLHDFIRFYKDLGPKPSKSHSVDRKDPNGDYCKDNCRWATPKEQSNNTRSNVRLTYKNETKTITQWAKDIGMSMNTLHSRVEAGWTSERAITHPIRKFKNKAIQYEKA